MKKCSEMEKTLIRHLSYGIYEYCKLDEKKATEMLYYMQITSVRLEKQFFCNKDKLWITLHRPGILIGPKGTTIEFLTKYINDNIKKDIVIHIEEDDLNYKLAAFSNDYSAGEF